MPQSPGVTAAPVAAADLRAMATECDRASLAGVAEVAIDLSPASRRSALVARTNAAEELLLAGFALRSGLVRR